MAKGRIYTSNYPETPPEWYWVSGLHDAGIVGVETIEFPFDYNKFIREKRKYIRNLLVLKINAKNALYDTTVKEIRLYNYKILTPHISIESEGIIWWMADRLIENDNDYVLEIDLLNYDSDPENSTFKIKFERAEVIRS